LQLNNSVGPSIQLVPSKLNVDLLIMVLESSFVLPILLLYPYQKKQKKLFRIYSINLSDVVRVMLCEAYKEDNFPSRSTLYNVT